MNAENLSINESTKWEEVKDLACSFPNGGVAVLLLAFLIKPIDLGNLARFVVSTDKSDTVRVA